MRLRHTQLWTMFMQSECVWRRHCAIQTAPCRRRRRRQRRRYRSGAMANAAPLLWQRLLADITARATSVILLLLFILSRRRLTSFLVVFLRSFLVSCVFYDATNATTLLGANIALAQSAT